MATRTIQIVTDDIDQSEGDVQTIRFSFDGANYEIDLGPQNRARFEQALALFIGHARRASAGSSARLVPSPTRSSPQTSDTTYARRWHVAEGLPVSDRGRLKPEQMAAWASAGAPRLDS